MADNLVVAKANNFIEASYKMTLDEMRVLALTLGVFDPDNPKREFDFTVAEFVEQFPDVNPDIAYVQVQNAIRKISSRWMTLEDNERVKREVAFVTDRTYFKKEGRFQIVFHEKLLPYIADIKRDYTKYQLEHIGALNSTNTIRLYELLARFKDTGWRTISVDELKEKLQIADKYPRYNSLNERVLTPAVKEINEKSDLLVSFGTEKRGRKITALKFSITRKSKAVNIENKRPPFPHKNKYGRFVKLDAQNPKMSSHEYGLWARDCLKILEDYYTDIEKVTNQDLCFYWIFLAGNDSNKSKLGTKADFLNELKKRGYKIVECELVKI